MKYGYARVSTGGQSVAAQVAALRQAGAEKVFKETASGARTASVITSNPAIHYHFKTGQRK